MLNRTDIVANIMGNNANMSESVLDQMRGIALIFVCKEISMDVKTIWKNNNSNQIKYLCIAPEQEQQQIS